MKNIKFHRVVLLIGIIIYISEIACFGFNETAESGWEKILDGASTLFIFWGLLGDVLSGININKYYAKENEYNVTDSVFKFMKGTKIKIYDKYDR